MTIHRIATSRRPSPSMVLSLIALFVALGGTSYAAVKIDANNVKPDTVTGTQAKERSLGKVPRARAGDTAALATTATNATNAPNAMNAATATNAANATHAQDATIAGNAARVGGKSAAELASPAAFTYIDASAGASAVPADEAGA